MTETCVFCEIVAGRAPSTKVGGTADTVTIMPLCPVTPGHVLVIPRRHVEDAASNPIVTSMAMYDAATYARDALDEFNILTSAGTSATQSVFHLHLHVVPRAADDGLMLPWGTLHGEDPKAPHRCRRVLALEEHVRDVVEQIGASASEIDGCADRLAPGDRYVMADLRATAVTLRTVARSSARSAQ